MKTYPHPEAFLRSLQERHGPPPLPLSTYVQFALYDDEWGYYRQPARRIGYDRHSDFYTACNLRIFPRLLGDAVIALAGGGRGDWHFVEWGSETGEMLFDARAAGFADGRCAGFGDPLPLEGKTMLFANELLDAQAFQRFVRSGPEWAECGVHWSGTDLRETLIPLQSETLPHSDLKFPDRAPEGYKLDWPSGSLALVENLACKDWQGRILFFDYGLNSVELLNHRPEGTARSYFNHRTSANIFENPGSRDITHDVCWDCLGAVLEKRGFSDVQLMSQESFLMTYAEQTIRSVVEAGPETFSGDRQSLMQLLHPTHMGQRFQVMTAARGA